MRFIHCTTIGRVFSEAPGRPDLSETFDGSVGSVVALELAWGLCESESTSIAKGA